MNATAQDRVYFEDVIVDHVFETPAITLTEAHVGMYGGLVDDRAAEARAVPELLPLCLSSGLGWRLPQPPLEVLAFMGFEWKFIHAASVGDTIRCVSRSLTKRAMKDAGVVVEERRILNQRDEVIQWGKLTLLVAKRPASGPAPAGRAS